MRISDCSSDLCSSDLLFHSTFSYFPGLPVFNSTDLFHWTQIGNAIDRPGMVDFGALGVSRGLYAPAISYHDGRFWIVNTCVDCGGNFVITATDPAGDRKSTRLNSSH